MNASLEKWIILNAVEGKPAVVKTLRQEPEDPEFWYQIRVDGMRFGQISMYCEDDLYYVVHSRSGRPCGKPFSSENDAKRMVFCIRKLADWRSIDWSDYKVYLKDRLTEICKEASAYCHNSSAICPKLMTLVESLLPKDEVEVVEELLLDAEPVSFGGVVQSSKSKATENKDEWGHTIT